MRKITPMILVALMLVSVLSSFDFAELEETEVIEDAGARAGADAEVIAITSPKETSCNQQSCRNEIRVGEETTFSAYIQNGGDADISEMGYSVSVYLSDDSGDPGMIAKDSAGNDLQWSNGQVICANANFCSFTSLAAGATLDDGKHTLQAGGSDITWTPARGQYVVQILVDSPDDVDVGNDAQEIYVSVVDWYDIELDLTWDSGADVESGSGVKQWSLSLTTNASDTFDPRNVTVEIRTTGEVLEAQTTDGVQILTSQVNLFNAGTATVVDVFENVTDVNATATTDTRNVLSTWTLNGSIEIDAPSTASQASYGLTASIVDYTMYGQFTSCQVLLEDNTTSDNFCEEVQTSDAYASTDDDVIDGYVQIFNDIRVTAISVAQGYNSDGTGFSSNIADENYDGELNVGTSYLHAEVEHRGSEPDTVYDWNVSLMVIAPGQTESNATLIENVTSCMAVEPLYDYKTLGSGVDEMTGESGDIFGYACAMINLDVEGEYTFKATINPIKMTDAKESNNDRSISFFVRNNAPIITSLDLVNDGDLYNGQDEPITLSADVFDVDDPTSESIQIEWLHNGEALPGCQLDYQLYICEILILKEYVTDFPVTVKAYDANGGESSKEIMLEIWNDGGTSSQTASDITVDYRLYFWGADEFGVSIADGDAMTGEELPGYTGLYDSVAVVDYTPSTTYQANRVLSQTMSVQFPKSTGASSLWYTNADGNIWQLLSNAATDVDATTSEFTYTFPSNTQSLANGKLVLIGDALAQADVPSASITGFSAKAAKGGAIVVNWNVDGTMLDGHAVKVTICETVNCTSAYDTSFNSSVQSTTYSGQNTVHGVEYTVTVAVCNEVGCSTPVGTGTVVADSKVDGGAAATDLTISASGNTWTVSWTASGDQADVDSWRVCYQRGSFTAAEIGETTCLDAQGTTLDVDISTWQAGTFTYHFAAVPVDALGNTIAAGSMNSIDYQRDADNTNTDDGSTVLDDDVQSGVPTWTWGVIGGVVVVAFIVGAFILSRGGDGDEGKDWDY